MSQQKKVLYNHRTQGLRAEGVHILGICNAFEEEGFKVDLVGPIGTNSFLQINNSVNRKSDDGHSNKRISRIVRNVVSKFFYAISKAPQILFEMAEFAYNLPNLIMVSSKVRKGRYEEIYERYSLFLFSTVWLAKRYNVPLILEVNDSILVERLRTAKTKWSHPKARKVVY